jgi:uncharacterized protein
MHGQFVWYDLMTSDLAGATKFYPTVLGWKAQEWDQATPDNPYTMWMYGSIPLGGVARISDAMRAQGVRPHWVPTVEVRNVDESTALARSLGAQVYFGPEEIPGTGRYVSLGDPQGATFAMFTPARPTPAFDGKPLPGRFSWHELMTTDYNAAFDFYRRLFGWEKISDFDMGGGHMYLMYGQNGRQYGGIYNRPVEQAQIPPNWLSYVNVKDVRKTTAAAKKAGGRLINGPMEVPGGDWIAAFTDPQGATFAIHQTKGAPATASAAKPRKAAARKKVKAKRARVKVKSARAKPRKKTASRKAAKTRSRPRVRATAKKRARRR